MNNPTGTKPGIDGDFEKNLIDSWTIYQQRGGTLDFKTFEDIYEYGYCDGYQQGKDDYL